MPLKFPQHVPFGMRPDSTPSFAQYHSGHMDTDWNKDLRLDFQYPVLYAHPVERTDRFRLMFDVTDNTGVQVLILDCSGATISSLSVPSPVDIPGNTTDTGGQWHSYKVKAADYSAVTADGIYFVVIIVGYSGGGSEKWVSEPIEIKGSHPGTVYLEYRHSTNKHGSYFEQLPCLYPFRVHGFRSGMQALSADTVYQDQNENTDVLDSIPYRSWKLNVGYTNEGVPDWVLDKLNWIFALDAILIDGKQYTKSANNAKWTKENDDDAIQLYNASIDIQEADISEGFATLGGVLPVYQSPGAYPYALYDLFVGFNLIQEARVIADGADEITFISDLNTALGNFDLQGSFSLSSGLVTYIKGTGDIARVAGAYLLTRRARFDLNTPGSLGDYTLSVKLSGNPVVMDWSNGAPDKWSTLGGTYYFPTHDFPGAPANYPVFIWHDALDHIEVTDTNTDTMSWPDNAPIGFKRLVLQMDSYPSDIFDWNDLSNAVSTLEKVSVTHTGLIDQTGLSSYSWLALDKIDFSNNAMSSRNASSVIDETLTVVTATGIVNGQLSVINQTPPAVIGGTSLANASLLSSIYNWSVNY